MQGDLWPRGPITDQPFMVIAGTYRAGTTSLFNYLADHPEVRPSSPKEPGFFFSLRRLEVPPAYPPGHEVEAYLSQFKRSRDGRVLLDGTPNYLHDPGCAERIARALPNAKVVVILREPIERLVSWYQHSVFQSRLPEDKGFAEWIDEQLNDPRPVDERDYMLRAVAHGRYADYVAEYVQVFGEDRVHVIWFDELERDAAGVMAEVSRFAGIDPHHFAGRTLTPQNSAMRMSRPWAHEAYILGTRAVLKLVRWSPRLEFRAKRIVYAPINRYLPLVTSPAVPVPVPEQTRARLEEYYRSDLPKLRALLGRPAPWESAYA